MTPIEETLIAANGLEFRALSAGKGPLVLLLHGFPDHAPSWRALLECLAIRGFRAGFLVVVVLLTSSAGFILERCSSTA